MRKRSTVVKEEAENSVNTLHYPKTAVSKYLRGGFFVLFKGKFNGKTI